VSRIVVAQMMPIDAKRVRWDRLIPAALKPTTKPGDGGKVDPANFITRTMHARLPWMTDEQLVEVRAHLVSRRTDATGILVKHASDIDAWIAMVDDESRVRRIARKATLVELIDSFTFTSPEGK
jgi:hypothetical protein